MNIKLKAIGLLLSPLIVNQPVIAESQVVENHSFEATVETQHKKADATPVVYLVVTFLRGAGMGLDGSSVSIPVSSIDQCTEQGAMMIGKNTKMIKTFFWCVEGVK
ncbi:hypothetical protein [Prochlorococcus sp. MIT 1201]|uniref:hypothetical protein n=1 Tax=Prochlorococcus sp. MIT 1201 TaxID=3082535 RepID=UPI0039A718DF